MCSQWIQNRICAQSWTPFPQTNGSCYMPFPKRERERGKGHRREEETVSSLHSLPAQCLRPSSEFIYFFLLLPISGVYFHFMVSTIAVVSFLFSL